MTSLVNHTGSPLTPVSQFDYTYDDNGNRLTQVERRVTLSGGQAETTTYGYDALNRLTSVAYPNGATITYTLAKDGNRQTESGTDPITSAAVNRAFEYDHVNRMTVVRDLASPAASVAFAYDRNGNTSEERTGSLSGSTIPAPTTTRQFTFDIRDRLVGVGTGASSTTFAYDFAGRRTSKRTGVVETRYLYDENALLQEYEPASGATQLK